MGMRTYNSFEEIDQDLKRLNLERRIAIEEIKLTHNQIREDLSPLNWINTLVRLFSKYGLYYLIRRLFR